jgi:hypothetical protein
MKGKPMLDSAFYVQRVVVVAKPKRPVPKGFYRQLLAFVAARKKPPTLEQCIAHMASAGKFTTAKPVPFVCRVRVRHAFTRFGWLQLANDQIERRMGRQSAPVYPDEIPGAAAETLTEGAKKAVIVNAYERNPSARRRCIEHWGSSCEVCSFNFGQSYGDYGKGFIHVHHLKPLASIGRAYELDPIQDMRPVCPNCHAMLHHSEQTLSIEELRRKLQNTHNS